MRTVVVLAAVSICVASTCAATGCSSTDPDPGSATPAVEVHGELARIRDDPPPGWPCDRDPRPVGCPDAAPIGHLTLDGRVVAITPDTALYGCGPNDGRERRPLDDLFAGIDGIDTGWALLAGGGPTLHALRLHVGFCG